MLLKLNVVAARQLVVYTELVYVGANVLQIFILQGGPLNRTILKFVTRVHDDTE